MIDKVHPRKYYHIDNHIGNIVAKNIWLENNMVPQRKERRDNHLCSRMDKYMRVSGYVLWYVIGFR